ncbi:MAG: Asp-tRNA(Asn)/Glu-tRNA(Gln) amidotransferase subunit GatA [Candidatus Dadabacteria bacterium]|nr:Asp-tRNA(Asn)/Glu-tRNA(Gln) amidotransferase subunit GatA [Candidatus Dadabacteria bacterium]NIS09208.1 Asp-tRNA(Asn)/Glu-tRNA(Gln) amidotransferase subunit GatA [Candidatus Dadabacteria bacterium]NIV43192.1 Asp-tRNA(Asn)/Glu-tRNA(Gln) amidotransferase subunit GatA [Candidatus Dadabacteria bacterium]NIY22258.1 Asp-tRNA(Asn)/Glu-tRNA(Gln) amidotransferase subunit GatA [Candidatus Dadabacteria bacterium]
MELYELTIKEVSELIRKKEVSPVELTELILARIEQYDAKINSYVTVLSDYAMKRAKEAEEEIAAGKYKGPLHGVPIGLKDIFVMKDFPTTAGSKILEGYMSLYNATVTEKLLDAGAVIVGKNNMDEFAMGSSNETSYYGHVKNPWDLDRVPGGSSGGSAAAVAASLCYGSVGTDTGGSIRQPASLCGIVGMKPTYGRVSRFGMIAFASSLDQAGPLTKSVYDTALILSLISGHEPRDSTSINNPVPDYASSLKADMKGIKVGIPKEYFIEGIDEEVLAAVQEAIKVVTGQGGEIVEISLPHTEYSTAAYYIIAPSEASSNLARFDGVKYGYRAEDSEDLLDMYKKTKTEGFGQEVKRRIMIGTYALSAGYYDAFYNKARRVQTLLRKDFQDAFGKVDVILTPTAAEPAFKIGEKTTDPIKMYLSDVFTNPTNLAGLPGISLPCGYTKNGLPIGLQFIGKPFDEQAVLNAAFSYESNTDWNTKRAELN